MNSDIDYDVDAMLEDITHRLRGVDLDDLDGPNSATNLIRVDDGVDISFSCDRVSDAWFLFVYSVCVCVCV